MQLTTTQALSYLLPIVWLAAYYCCFRTWTPDVREAWEKRIQGKFFKPPRTIPPKDLLGPQELPWYNLYTGFISFFFMLGAILVLRSWARKP